MLKVSTMALLIVCTAAFAQVEPSLLDQQYVVLRQNIGTDGGPQLFLAVEGLFLDKGSNYDKMFAQKMFATTLWSTERRLECYQHALKVSAQLASVDPSFSSQEKLDQLLASTNRFTVPLDALTTFDLLKTSYIKNIKPPDQAVNKLIRALRAINPKSQNGIQLAKLGKKTNLAGLSDGLTAFEVGTTISGIVFGAAFQQALAGDAALDRLELIRSTLEQVKGKGVSIDPLWFKAIDETDQALRRDENYYGALLNEIEAKKGEIVSQGIEIALPRIIEHFHGNIEQYVAAYLKAHAPAMHGTHITTFASSAAVLWSVSLIATYETIDGLLEQHKKAQGAVAAATLDYLLHQGINKADNRPLDMEAIILQNQYTYFDKMQQTCNAGLLTGLRDFVDHIRFGERRYSEASEFYADEKNRVLNKLAELTGTKPKKTVPTNDMDRLRQLGIEMVFIPGGTFEMGDTFGDGNSDERPVHTVTVSDFYLGKTEVTVTQYRAFCNATGRNMPELPNWGRQDNQPIVNVSWHDAVTFCQWAKCRLPTEAEWEFAAREGGKRIKWSGTNSESQLGDYAWYDANSGRRTHPVATKLANALGLYDMSGNAWEWCEDWWDYNYYQISPSVNPQGQSVGIIRVLRGGSWLSSDSRWFRCSFRLRNNPGNRSYGSGFRVARSGQ